MWQVFIENLVQRWREHQTPLHEGEAPARLRAVWQVRP